MKRLILLFAEVWFVKRVALSLQCALIKAPVNFPIKCGDD